MFLFPSFVFRFCFKLGLTMKISNNSVIFLIPFSMAKLPISKLIKYTMENY